MLILIRLLWTSVLLVNCAAAQVPPADPALPPGIVLLSGYEHEPLSGIDSTVGKIFKADGLTIFYDIGDAAGSYATGNIATNGNAGTRIWLKSVEEEDRRVDVALTVTESRRLFVSFTQKNIFDRRDRRNNWFFANFWGTAETEEDVAEMLVMVMGYNPR